MQLAKCSLANSERDAQRVLVKQFGLALDVPMSQLETSDPALDIPILRLRDWCQFLLQNNCWHLLTGLVRPDAKRECDIWSAFWTRFKRQFPTHPIHSMDIDTSRCAAVYFHGDEGRGRKHSAFLVTSFHSVLGRGLRPSNQQTKKSGVRKPYLKMLPNFVGHTYTNRFLLAAVRKADYTGDHQEVFESLMQLAASEAKFMCTTGVQDKNGNKFYMLAINIVGDWPWLHKSGKFTRSFNNVQKQLTQKSFLRVCHLCRAGQTDIPFEQINTRRPLWLPTMHEQNPFQAPSPFAQLPHPDGQTASIWAFDLFHNWHLGVAKSFLGGVLALLSEREEAGNVDDRFAALSEKYKAWCRQNQRRGYILKLTKECLGWTTTNEFPAGTWHKGALSTNLMEWVESMCDAEGWQDEPLLLLVRDATLAIQTCVRSLYTADVWLTPGQSNYICSHGMRFLRRYAELARASLDRKKHLFPLQPKVHALHHLMLYLHDAYVRDVDCISPICTSVQADEDFIGRPSRLSRRTTARAPVLRRVVQRYLQSAYVQWLDAGLLARPEEAQ